MDKVKALGAKCICIQADVSKEKEVEYLFEQIDSKLGKIRTLVNNVGILKTQISLVKMSFERFQQVIETNIYNQFLCAKSTIKRMEHSSGGSGGTIVNISSVASRSGVPFEYVNYATSKGAIDSFTIGLSKEIAADGLQVNCIRPSGIYTDIHSD